MKSKRRAIKLLSKHNKKKIKSVGTRRNYTACVQLYLDWCDLNDVPADAKGSKFYLESYLEEKAETCKQRTICQSRMALNKAYNKKLPFVKSQVDTVLASRSYSLAEVLLMVRSLHAKNAISILICFYAGLRAHELCTIQRLDEASRSSKRTWSSELFTGLEQYQLYVVTGKGGLRRHVAIPNELASIIESHRLSQPKQVRDREVIYQMWYDVGFGKALSQCFTRASQKHLGWSTGLHGLRHSYAKNRLRVLLTARYPYEQAKSIVSQELGHFRPSIVNCYLR